jgi:N-acetylmuramoyl-L-alanine amidase
MQRKAMTNSYISHLSPNYDERNADDPVDVLVLHYTGMQTAAEALSRMCDPQAQVSAHYMVDEEGSIYKLVEEKNRAWHAGISCWKGRASLNYTSIGIEIANPGHEWGYRAFPLPQMAAIKVLCKDILSRHDIPPENVVGHSDIAPNRKEDPGELFDWPSLAKDGIGLWPDVGYIKNASKILVEPFAEGTDVAFMQQRLATYGYHIRVDGFYGTKTEAVVKGFKRHFVPEQLNTQWDMLAEARLSALLKLIEKNR